MRNYLITSLLLMILLVSSYLVFAQAITYDFDEVNVLYAAEFTAKPIDGSDFKDTWVADIAVDNPKVTVTYGVVELKRNGEVLVTEEFLKVGGDKGSKRFLVDSVTSNFKIKDPEVTGATIRYIDKIKSFFWSAKKLEGNTIIKDKTSPIYAVILLRTFDEKGNRDSFYLTFSNDGEEMAQKFWEDNLPKMYEVDIRGIIESGSAIANSGVVPVQEEIVIDELFCSAVTSIYTKNLGWRYLDEPKSNVLREECEFVYATFKDDIDESLCLDSDILEDVEIKWGSEVLETYTLDCT